MQVLKNIPVSGFDPEGEPEIQLMADGSIWVLFNFMPPSDMNPLDSTFMMKFEQQMSKSVGVHVQQEDREQFVIPSPCPDTMERVKQFLETYRERFAADLRP